jgi:hypothetical protein
MISSGGRAITSDGGNESVGAPSGVDGARAARTPVTTLGPDTGKCGGNRRGSQVPFAVTAGRSQRHGEPKPSQPPHRASLATHSVAVLRLPSATRLSGFHRAIRQSRRIDPALRVLKLYIAIRRGAWPCLVSQFALLSRLRRLQIHCSAMLISRTKTVMRKLDSFSTPGPGMGSIQCAEDCAGYESPALSAATSPSAPGCNVVGERERKVIRSSI